MLFFLVGIPSSWIYCVWKGETYTSKASLELISAPLDLLNSTYFRKVNVSTDEARTHLYKIKSYTLAQAVAKVITLNKSLHTSFIQSLENVWKYKNRNFTLEEALQENVDATYRDGVVTVFFTFPNKVLAPIIVDIYAKEYISLESGSMSYLLQNELNALKAEEERRTLAIRLQSDRLNELSRNNPTVNLDISSEDRTRSDYLNAINANEKKVSELESQLSQVLPLINDIDKLQNIFFIANHPGVAEASNKLIALNEKLQKLSVTYGNKHPKRIEIIQLIHETKNALSAASQDAIKSLESSWRQAKTNLDTSKERLSQYTDIQIKNKVIIQSYQNNLEDLTRNRNRLNEIRQKISQTNVVNKKGFSSIKILSQSEGIVEPSGVSKPITLSLGFILSLTFGLITIYALFRLDPKFSLGDSNKFEDIPVLAKLPKFNSIPKTSTIPTIPTVHIEASSISNHFDELVASIFLKSDEFPRRVMLVVSAIPGEGKTFVAINLAINCASKNEKVLLLDTNFRHSTVCEALHQNHPLGLKNYLLEGVPYESIIAKTNHDNLSLIHSGGNSHAAVNKLNSPEFKQLIHRLEKNYDRIIVDSAPLSLYGDANFIIPWCDSALIVAAERKVNTETLTSVINKLRMSDVDILGLVVNFSLFSDKHASKHNAGLDHESQSKS